MAKMDASGRWWTYAVVVSMLSCYCDQICDAASSSMTVGQQLKVSETIVSPEGFYELGFFSPVNSTNLYLGIWFKKALTRAVVWVSNRDQPLTTSSPVLSFLEDGNLVISDGENSIMVTNASTNSKNITAVLLDSGNLVLRDRSSKVLWESFDYPTDTVLADMKYGYDKSIGKVWSFRAWKNARDPGSGAFHMELDSSGSGWSFISRYSQTYGTYWVTDKPNSTWFFDMVSTRIYFSYMLPKKDTAFIIFRFNNKDFSVRYVLDSSGQLMVYFWTASARDWIKLWSLPDRQCDFYGYCGNFGICDQQTPGICACLPGYQPANLDSWENENYGVGCKRRTPLKCGVTEYLFKLVPKVTLPAHSLILSEIQDIDDCRSICKNNCSCDGFSFSANQCAILSGDVTNVQQLPDNDITARNIYIKVAASEFIVKDYNQPVLTGWKLWIMAISGICLTIIAIALFIYGLWQDKIKQEKGMDLLSYDFSSSPGEITGNEIGKDKEEDQIPLFNFPSVCAATEDFSAANKLGKGGFGAVYMGTLLNRDEIAVKRLSKIPEKGWKELKEESTLIAELQHHNLAKLLGCCFEGNENIFIYEYFSNKSLDFFLFDPAMPGTLDWGTRARIIDGIALGLNYLHEHSRSQIIHGNLKASNILLDENMNPKISDFAIARIFSPAEMLATNRMFGTFGYMAPEYASMGIVSNKSDVYSFGILLLEILSGKKNNFRNDSSNLLGYAWDLWKCRRPLDLVDPTVGDTSSGNMLRYIEIALLCVQENANDRPTMSDVVSFLGNEVMSFPTPQEPALSKTRNTSYMDDSTEFIMKSD